MTTHSVSVTEFEAHCLDMIRQVERGEGSVELTRHGKVVGRMVPTTTAQQVTPPWLRLRGCGVLFAQPEESVFDDAAFDALSEDGQ